MQPLISIVIPSYNHARYITKAIDSILSQTFLNWEVIVVDNYSTDETDSVLENYEDNRIRCFKINNEGVIAKSRNKGIQESNGDWIAFLDSDDWWTNIKLEQCLNVMSESVDLIYHDLNIFYDGEESVSEKVMKSRYLNNPVLRDLIIKGNCIINSSVIIRKSLLVQVNGMDERRDLITAEDYHCWLKVAELTNNFFYLNKSLGMYRIHQQGMSQRDVVKQTQLAVKDFIDCLSVRDQLYARSFISYFRIVNRQQVISSSDLMEEMLFCVRYGKMDIKFKSIAFSIKIYLKRLIGKRI